MPFGAGIENQQQLDKDAATDSLSSIIQQIRHQTRVVELPGYEKINVFRQKDVRYDVIASDHRIKEAYIHLVTADRDRVTRALTCAMRDRDDDRVLLCFDIMAKTDIGINLQHIDDAKDNMKNLVLQRGRELEFSSCADVYDMVCRMF